MRLPDVNDKEVQKKLLSVGACIFLVMIGSNADSSIVQMVLGIAGGILLNVGLEKLHLA